MTMVRSDNDPIIDSETSLLIKHSFQIELVKQNVDILPQFL